MAEITKAVEGAIDALKSSPIVLALVLFQFALLALVGWSAHQVRTADQARLELVLKQCGPAQPG